MEGQCGKSLSTLGFLTVIENPVHGLFGGLLVLNPLGRPLEFHCTAPVKVSRAQQILYGPTLESYLFAEQIGQTLLAKSKLKPAVVLTDRRQMLEVREYVATPVAWVETPRLEKIIENASENSPEAENVSGSGTALENSRSRNSYRLDGPLISLMVADQKLAIRLDQRNEFGQLEEELNRVARRLDLTEPFERIREAIREAQRIQGEG